MPQMHRSQINARQSFALFALLLPVLFAGPAQADNELVRAITVSGKGEISAKPDTAFIRTGVTTRKKRADRALAENSKKMRNIITALKNAGLEAEDIQTVNFSISPQQKYFKNGRPPEITGYVVTNSVRIRVRKIRHMSQILDELVSLGSNQINGISFSVADPDKLLDRARLRAVREARRLARLYAKAAGVELGAVLSLSEQSTGGHGPRPTMMRQMRRAASSTPPIAAGSQKWSVTVNMRFALE